MAGARHHGPVAAAAARANEPRVFEGPWLDCFFQNVRLRHSVALKTGYLIQFLTRCRCQVRDAAQFAPARDGGRCSLAAAAAASASTNRSRIAGYEHHGVEAACRLEVRPACACCRVVAAGPLFRRRLRASRSVLGEFPQQDSRRRTISCRLFWIVLSFSTRHLLAARALFHGSKCDTSQAIQRHYLYFNSWKEACPT